VAEGIRQQHARGKYYSMVVVRKGAKFAEEDLATKPRGWMELGHARWATRSAWGSRKIEKRTGTNSSDSLENGTHSARNAPPFRSCVWRRATDSAQSIMVHRGEFGKAARCGKQAYFYPAAEALA